MTEPTNYDIMKVLAKLSEKMESLEKRFDSIDYRIQILENGMARREDLRVLNAEVKLIGAKLDREAKNFGELFQDLNNHVDVRLAAAGF